MKNNEEHNHDSIKSRTCRDCKQDIHPEASKCNQCGAYQQSLRIFFANVPLLTSIMLVLVAIAQVMIGYVQMQGAKQKQIEASEALEKASIAQKVALKAARNIDTFVEKSKRISKEVSNIRDHIKIQADSIELAKKESQLTLKQIKEMQKGIYAMKKYGGIGRINFNGSNQLGGGVSTASALYNWSKGFVKLQINHKEGTWKLVGNEMCSPPAMEQYRSIIKQYSFWPFSHYVLANCLKHQGDKSWENHAQKSLTILNGVTQVPGHDQSYAIILEATKKLLKEK